MQSDDDCSERGITFDASFFIFYSISGKQKSQGTVCRTLWKLSGRLLETLRDRQPSVCTLRNLSKWSIIVCTYVLTARETAGKPLHGELPYVLLS